MQLQRLCIVVFLALVLLPGCTSTPSTPTSPGSTAASNFQSGWTLSGQVVSTSGSPVPGASIQYGGHQVQTNGAGGFSVTHQVASTSSLTLTHPSILERRVWVNGAQSRTLTLDPIALAPPFDLTFYRQFVRNDRDEPGDLQPVRRWTTAPKFYIQTVDDFGDAVGVATVQSTIEGIVAGVTQLTPFTAPLIVTGTEPRDPERGWIRVLYKRWTASFRDGGICGTAYVGADPGEINLWLDRCRCSGDPGRVSTHLVLHEVGHAMGFWHVDGRHVMTALGVGCGPGERASSATERFHAAIAYTRPPGNMDPDTDPSSGAFSLAEAGPAPVISCGLSGPTQGGD